MKKNLFVVALALGFMAVSSARGALIMTIDTSAKTFWLSGSDSGTTDDMGRMFWSYTATASAFEWVSGSLFDVSGSTDGYQYLALYSYGAVNLHVTSLDPSTFFTLTGTETAHSYTSLSGSAIAVLEGLDGVTLTPGTASESGGGGFSNIAVNVVPEPTSVALLGLGAAALALRRRRA